MTRSEIVVQFFALYTAHDVDAMVALCADDATLRYIPEGERGVGPIRGGGEFFWRTFVDVIPDFRVEVKRIEETVAGNVVCETLQGGTLTKDVGPVSAKGRTTLSPHFYWIDFTPDGQKIQKITCQWDYNTIYAQLGHTETHE